MPYHPRSDWRLRLPKTINSHPVTSKGNAVSLIVLHHTVTPTSPFFGILQGIERDHISGRYDDFAYNGAAANDEFAYTDGRGPTVLGGATGSNMDPSSLSIVAVGDFHTSDRAVPSRILVDNIAELIVRWIRQGHVSRDFDIKPHRDFYATACCGDRLVRRIPAIKARVADKLEGDEEMLDMDDWYKYYNRAKDFEYHPAITFMQRGLKKLDLYNGPTNGRKNARTRAAWEAFERATKGTDNDDVAGPASWKGFLVAVFTENDYNMPLDLAMAIDRAFEEVKAAKLIADKFD